MSYWMDEVDRDNWLQSTDYSQQEVPWDTTLDSWFQSWFYSSDDIITAYILVQATLFVFFLPIHWLSQVLFSYFYACAKAIWDLVYFIYWKNK